MSNGVLEGGAGNQYQHTQDADRAGLLEGQLQQGLVGLKDRIQNPGTSPHPLCLGLAVISAFSKPLELVTWREG